MPRNRRLSNAAHSKGEVVYDSSFDALRSVGEAHGRIFVVHSFTRGLVGLNEDVLSPSPVGGVASNDPDQDDTSSCEAIG